MRRTDRLAACLVSASGSMVFVLALAVAPSTSGGREFQKGEPQVQSKGGYVPSTGKGAPETKGGGVPTAPASTIEVRGFDRLSPNFTVKQVDRRGDVQLVAIADQPARPPVAEGYALIVARTPETGEVRLFRAQVAEVDPAAGARATVAPEAASRLKARDSVLLFRPPGASTAQLRSLPPVLTVSGGGGPASPKQAAALAASVANLKRIGLALHNYHTAFNAFPPAVVYGPDGKPWHSWRVLILPYLDAQPLFSEYDFRQPWDSPKNLKVLDRMPAVYRDPVYGVANGHFTNYAAPSGRKAGKMQTPTALVPGPRMKDAKGPVDFRDPNGTSLRTVFDGTSNTIAVGPVGEDRKIPWTKPDDIPVAVTVPAPGKPGGFAAPYQSGGARVAPVLMLDGSVRLIPETIDPDQLAGLVTTQGGEIVNLAAFPSPTGGGSVGGSTLRIDLSGPTPRATIE